MTTTLSTALGLDNLSLARKEGWMRLVEAPARGQPPRLSPRQLAALDQREREHYDDARMDWHANLGPLKTPQLAAVHEDLWDIVDSNRQDGDKAKGAAAIDAHPGLGKTTAAVAFAKEFHRREVRRHGPRTPEGHERLPVCRIGLTSNTTTKALNQAICEFYAHPGANRGTANQLASRALDCILSCQSRLVVVDDVHFLNMRRRDGLDVSNHLKWLANEFPVTFLFAGVGLRERGLLSEGLASTDAVMAQTSRRWTRLTMDPFEVRTEQGRAYWRSLLLAIEQRVVLADAFPGMLAEELSDYLFARSTGHIGSLMSLIARGTLRAIRSGQERLTVSLLDQVKLDEAAEQARTELAVAMAAGRLTSRPRSKLRPARKAQSESAG